MANSHHKVVACKDVQLAKFHFLGVIEIARWAQDGEECGSIAFKLWSLMR